MLFLSFSLSLAALAWLLACLATCFWCLPMFNEWTSNSILVAGLSGAYACSDLDIEKDWVCAGCKLNQKMFIVICKQFKPYTMFLNHIHIKKQIKKMKQSNTIATVLCLLICLQPNEEALNTPLEIQTSVSQNWDKESSLMRCSEQPRWEEGIISKSNIYFIFMTPVLYTKHHLHL